MKNRTIAMILVLTSLARSATAADPGERVNVDQIKEKYWARGEESELGVVQNRLYSKSRRFELGAFAATLPSDPFLSTTAYGFSLGYSFTEFLGLRALAWKSIAQGSSAREALELTGKRASTNEPQGYWGAEAVWSPIYGKLSLLGSSILYYDFHLLAGAGVTVTENPAFRNCATAHLGLGQQFYLNQKLALQFDYRMMVYSEHLREKEITARLGQDLGSRTNTTHAISLGVNFLFGGGQ